MNVTTILSVVGLCFSGLSVLCVFYFNHKNSKTTDIKDIEQRVAERTETNMKLDEINRNTQEIRYDISTVKKDVQRHSEKIIELDSTIDNVERRVETIENRLNRKGDNN